MLMQTTAIVERPANLLLNGLDPGDRALIAAKLERHTVASGALLFGAAEVPSAIYFPETVIVSIECAGDRLRPRVETAIVGHEGLVGWSALVGPACSDYSAVVQMRAGTVLRIAANDVASACAQSRTLLLSILRFIEAMTVQMGQAIVSHLRDTVERRLCRWLLMRHDRMVSDHLQVKHDAIAANLGVRRASVTDGLHVLEGERLVRCRRGRIIIRDRSGLERAAGASYGKAEAYYRDQIGPFGRRLLPM